MTQPTHNLKPSPEVIEEQRCLLRLHEEACERMRCNPDGFFGSEYHAEAIAAESTRQWLKSLEEKQ